MAIVPARSGSKGLPNKNVLYCAGKPLIAWTIDAASKSKYIDCVLVSTDSESIANIARRYGAWVPSLRGAHLAKDDSSVIDVVKNAISEAESHGKSFEYIALFRLLCEV